LARLRYSHNARGQIVIEAKEAMKKRRKIARTMTAAYEANELAPVYEEAQRELGANCIVLRANCRSTAAPSEGPTVSGII
jgi:hypothetical protein